MSHIPAGRIALVTGASTGFGAAIARRLVAEGYRVIGAARRGDPLQALREELDPSFLPWPLDVTDKAVLAALPQALPEGWREVDVLVNNAGLALGMGPAHQADLVDWDTMVAVNVTGLIHLTRAILPGMVARDRGLVINLSSVAGDYPYPGGHVYGASKAFVTQFTLNLKADLIGTGVRVSSIEPGMVGGTEFSQVRFGGDEVRAGKVYEGVTPLNAGDIADTVAWIASLPPHMNVNRIELMPTCQAPAAPAVKRG